MGQTNTSKTHPSFWLEKLAHTLYLKKKKKKKIYWKVSTLFWHIPTFEVHFWCVLCAGNCGKHRNVCVTRDVAYLMRFCVAVCMTDGTASSSKLPMSEKATEMELKFGVCAPCRSQPHPMYALPSPPIRKLYPMSAHPGKRKVNPGANSGF